MIRGSMVGSPAIFQSGISFLHSDITGKTFTVCGAVPSDCCTNSNSMGPVPKTGARLNPNLQCVPP